MANLTKFLVETREVVAKATVTPWVACLSSKGFEITAGTYGPSLLYVDIDCEANQAFIAFARNHWDEMISLIEKQNEELTTLKKLHTAPWCDNESDDELQKKLERQGKALEVARGALYDQLIRFRVEDFKAGEKVMAEALTSLDQLEKE